MPVVDYGREAISSECPLQHHTVGSRLQALIRVLRQRPEEEKAKTLTVQTVIFYHFLTVIEVNRHRCISVGIISMFLDPYDNIYEPASGKNKWFTLTCWLAS